MSILIRGIEMPKNCGKCFACKAELSQEKKVIYVCCFTRTDCPLVPVPPHGRLIDADALYERYWAEERTLDKPYIDYLGILATESPTIIPAEEGEA